MFYSHEILTSPQHGVATIWLVATVGPRGSGRKLTRKTIQEVDVKRACKKFIEPGAPLALRLQGSLLYGVARVYSQQCNYVLSDAEKVQNDMRLFYRLVAQNATDPLAGKARRDQNIIPDDPNFVPEVGIPPLDFDFEGNTLVKESQASSRMVYSQLSPADLVSSAGRDGSIVDFDFSQSEGGHGSVLFPTPAKAKSVFRDINLPEARIDIVQEMDQQDDIGFISLDMEIADDGTVIGFADDMDLPPLPFPSQGVGHVPTKESVGDRAQLSHELQNDPIFDEGGDMFMVDVPQNPVPERLDSVPRTNELPGLSTDSGSSVRHRNARRQPARRRSSRKMAEDVVTNFTPKELLKMTQSYAERCEAQALENWPPKVTPRQAQKNAFAVVFGQGLFSVGHYNDANGFRHPLAEMFAGEALQAQVFDMMGIEELESDGDRSSRRSASEAFAGDEEQEVARRVRPRLEAGDDRHPGRGTQQPGLQDAGDDGAVVFGDNDFQPEEARDQYAAKDDRMSSSIMPWNHTPSVHRPSSVMGSKHNAPGSRQPTGSPKIDIRTMERYSDGPGAPTSELGFGPLPSLHSDFEEFGPAALVTTQQAEDSQWMHSALDAASNEFLLYVNEQAKRSGGLLEGEQNGRLWIEFGELATPGEHTKIVAAQAFLHVLTLSTKNVIKVDQDVENNQPFGPIHIGTIIDVETEDASPIPDGNDSDVMNV